MKLTKNHYLAIAGLAILALGCKDKAAAPFGKNYPTLVLAAANDTLSNSYSATIEGRQDVDIYPDVSGKITEVRVNEGDRVRKGQILFVIDQMPYKAALQAAEANLAAAEAEVKMAQLDYESTKDLYDNKVVSAYELQSAENTLSSAEAARAQMEALRVEAANNLSYTEVKSPANGVAGAIPYREGTLVSSAMSKPLTTVSDNSEMYVYFSMDEKDVLDLIETYGSLEQAAREMPELQLQLSNGKTYCHPGHIASISGVINPTTGSVSVRAIFPNPEGLILSGATGSVLMPEVHKDVLRVPIEATYELQDKIFVYKVVNDTTRATQIQVYPYNDGQHYILQEGLQAGDEIIATGAGLLREGIRVKNNSTANANHK